VVVACFVFGCLLAFRNLKVTCRRWYGPVLLTIAFAVWMVPLLPAWIQTPERAFPRAQESISIYNAKTGFDWDRIENSLREPLARSFGWFFVMRDQSSQGTLSPGCNEFESVLLAVGIAIAIIEGFSLNLLFLGFIFLSLLVCGAWSYTPPWYTRLVPTAPVAAVLIARAATGLHDLFRLLPASIRKGLFAALILCGLVLSPGLNLLRYLRYEQGRAGTYPLAEMTAVGRRIRELGQEYHYYLVITHRPDWTLDCRGRPRGRFGELLPYIWDKRITEIRELPTRLPLPSDQPAAVFVQASRFEDDVGLLKKWYPDAEVEEIRGFRGELLAGLVLILPKQ
jgi:hypothetical protein